MSAAKLLNMGELDVRRADLVEGVVWELPPEVQRAMWRALASGDYTIGAGAFETELAVCPLVAASREAGIAECKRFSQIQQAWRRDDPIYGVWAFWFAHSFDDCAKELGLDVAVTTLRETLERVVLLERRRARKRRRSARRRPRPKPVDWELKLDSPAREQFAVLNERLREIDEQIIAEFDER